MAHTSVATPTTTAPPTVTGTPHSPSEVGAQASVATRTSSTRSRVPRARSRQLEASPFLPPLHPDGRVDKGVWTWTSRDTRVGGRDARTREGQAKAVAGSTCGRQPAARRPSFGGLQWWPCGRRMRRWWHPTRMPRSLIRPTRRSRPNSPGLTRSGQIPSSPLVGGRVLLFREAGASAARSLGDCWLSGV